MMVAVVVAVAVMIMSDDRFSSVQQQTANLECKGRGTVRHMRGQQLLHRDEPARGQTTWAARSRLNARGAPSEDPQRICFQCHAEPVVARTHQSPCPLVQRACDRPRRPLPAPADPPLCTRRRLERTVAMHARSLG